MLNYGVNLAFLFVKGIWLHRKSRPIRFFSEKDLCSDLPSYISTMGSAKMKLILLQKFGKLLKKIFAHMTIISLFSATHFPLKVICYFSLHS